ncbi:MAG TPA: site-specific integrase [Gemmataceae bacterium]|nr:site-specific integrase [Gemmataceae bacterium]
MSKSHSSKSPVPSKPERPLGSPLFWHATGRWCKKIRGKQHYFGRGTHDEALAEFERQKNDLYSGIIPQDEPEGLTVYTLCAKFLKAKKEQRNNDELAPRSFLEYGLLCNRLTKVFGKNRLVSDLRPDDFAKLRAVMAKTWGPVRLSAEIVRSRVPFNWAYKSALLDRPMTFGEGFKRPSRKTLRKHKAEMGPRMFEAKEIRRMIEAAGQPLRAMILLGVNCGFSNSDIGALPIKSLDLEGGWIAFPRVKTGIMRKCRLWPETVAALRKWLAIRPQPKNPKHDGLVFLTRWGDCWAKEVGNPVCWEMRKLLDKLETNGGRTFYHLRHTLQTIGDECGDFLAVRHIMGHASNDIADTYRERMSDARLIKVADHVRAWVFASEGQGEDAEPAVVKFRQAR